MQKLSHSVAETRKIAAELAKKIKKLDIQKSAVVIALEGELGSGKTTFIQGFAKALGIKQNLTSPTFVLLKKYSLDTARYRQLFHIDVYRLKNHYDLLPLGITEIISNSQNIVLIEWADRVKKILPKNHISIKFEHIDKSRRRIHISNYIKNPKLQIPNPK